MISKKSIFLVLIFSLIFFSVGVLAEDNSTDFLDQAEEEYGDVELASAGLTPDSPLYFIDEFFDQFKDDLEVREEKFAEFLDAKERGSENAAKIALEKYNGYVKKLENEVDPARREDTRRSAVAIKNAARNFGDSEEFKEILENEEKLVTAVEIADKIRDLCENLAELDPNSYYKNCKVEEDGPEWQKELDKKLTGEQRKVAEKFMKVMTQCFETSGQECNCEEIPFPDFANACSEAAPLATACDLEEDEVACEKLDNLEMPELPPYLQEIFEEMDGEMSEAQYDMHMPRECVEAGATTPKECGKIMIQLNAPEECREALLEADVKNEREGREICEKIMMQKHAPECVDEGITDPKECKEFMWGLGNRPPECQENGIHDLRDCKEFLEKRGNLGERERRGGPRGSFNCAEIEDSEERLNCYDGALGDVRDFGERHEEIREEERQCAEECDSKGGAWDFSGGECECRFFKEGDYDREKFRERDERREFEEGFRGDKHRGDFRKDFEEDKYGSYEESECKEGCQDECPGANRVDCIDERCECFYEGEEYKEDYSNYQEENSEYQEEDYTQPEIGIYEDPSNYQDEFSGELEEDFNRIENNQEEFFEEPPQEEDSFGITGNAFLDYSFR